MGCGYGYGMYGDHGVWGVGNARRGVREGSSRAAGVSAVVGGLHGGRWRFLWVQCVSREIGGVVGRIDSAQGEGRGIGL